MPRTSPLLALAVVLTLAGCAIDVNNFDRPAAPDRVRPTLDAWTEAGMVCRGPTEDKIPSGLLQWSCRGTLGGVEISGNLDGDEKGVFGFRVVVPVATEADTASDVSPCWSMRPRHSMASKRTSSSSSIAGPGSMRSGLSGTLGYGSTSTTSGAF